VRKLILSFLLFLIFNQPIFALENNKIGIHITQTEDLEKAAQLVNSQGGDWGYVTVVIQETDRNYEKWQNFFDQCREKHLIPLVRIATHLEGETWAKPSESSIEEWADFLTSLNWPVKNRYVIVFNEPNHAKEWGGRLDPGEYAIILTKAIDTFKQKNQNFLILNAGLDQAASDSQETMDEIKFLRKMDEKVPGIFLKLDGWVSHSYPNHGFVGKPWETGRATIKGYEWELSILKNLKNNFNLSSDLPIFISETGWPHQLKNKNERFYSEKVTANFIRQAFENIWLKDEKVMAVTPFILNYPYYPFANFSWLDSQGEPYPQFNEVKSIGKVKGEPQQEESSKLENIFLPPFLTTNFVFEGKVVLKNTGQSIWGEKEWLRKANSPGLKLSDLKLPEGKLVKPGETIELSFTLETPAQAGVYSFFWEGLPKFSLRVFDLWGLTSSKKSPLNIFLESLLKLKP